MKNIRLAAVLLSGVCAIGVAGCEKGETKDAQWYLKHSAELQQKLESCKADADAAKGDEECAAAMQAFLKWYAASGQAAAAADARLTAPASADASATAQPATPDSAADPQTTAADAPATAQDAEGESAAPTPADPQD
jgi:hypothetical protein